MLLINFTVYKCAIVLKACVTFVNLSYGIFVRFNQRYT